MVLHRTSFSFSMLALVILVGISSVTFAAETGKEYAGVPLPNIPMGQGASCVEDTDFMRRNHMDILKHQRDETMLKGLRAEQYSLKECINCHVVKGADSKPVTVASEQHFCRSCHDYAAVSIDCFQCHASRPEPVNSTDAHQLSSTYSDTVTANGSR